MNKIMFNDKYGLTKAVLEGRKTQTRRIIKVQPPYMNYDMAFPVFKEEYWHTNPLYGAFCWVNKYNPNKHTDWIKPTFKVGEVVAIAQTYEAVFEEQKDDTLEMLDLAHNSGWNNKMFVKPELMPHQIRITNVSIQRLQDISYEDCLKEGVVKDTCKTYFNGYTVKFGLDQYNNILSSEWFRTPREAFAHLINKVSGKGTWESNPYVWVYDFELIK